MTPPLQPINRITDFALAPERPPFSCGVVYAVDMGGLLKIGRTSRPCLRFRELHNECRNHKGVPPEFYVFTDFHGNYSSNEAQLHKTLQDLRVYGEFFTPHERVWNELRRLTQIPYSEEPCTSFASAYLKARVIRETRQAIQLIARERQVSESDVFREAIREYLDNHPPKRRATR